jgi:phospholipid/cholesterol/gamma-HCH transport system permease protein
MNTQSIMMEIGKENAAQLEIIRQSDEVRMVASGNWTGAFVHLVDKKVRQFEAETHNCRLSIDMSSISNLDTAGAWILRRLQRSLEDDGQQVDRITDNQRHLELLDAVDFQPQPIEAATRSSATIDFLAKLGRGVFQLKRDFVLGTNIIGASIRGAQMKPGKPGSIRLTSIIHQMEVMGFQAVPIIALMSFLIGIIIAQQGALQLKYFGAEILVVNLVGILHLREIGVLLTAIMIAGRTGSAITAELGSMKMREEVDALTVIGLNPIGVLIFPRIVALILVLPLLTFVSDMFGIIGAIIITWAYVGITPELFIATLRDAIDLSTVFSGLIKAPFMALIIAVVSSLEGMKVSGSAESLGKHTTAAVVKSIFLVIVVDGLFAIFYGMIDY